MPRKQAFSGKQKKKQLLDRRERKKDADEQEVNFDSHLVSTSSKDLKESKDLTHILRLNEQPSSATNSFDTNKYKLHFLKLSDAEVARGKAIARTPIVLLQADELEMSLDSANNHDVTLDFPKRPLWQKTMTKSQLERQEKQYFSRYMDDVLKTHGLDRLSYFELNLETWRQLWRVIDISDVFLLIADVRHPRVKFLPEQMLHLPHALYRYLQDELKRDVIVVLNKVDLSPTATVAAWKAYISTVFPQAHIACFSTSPCTPSVDGCGFFKNRRKCASKPFGPQKLLDVCRQLVGDKVDLDSWQSKIDSHDVSTSAPVQPSGSGDGAVDAVATTTTVDTSTSADGGYGTFERYRDGIVTIGCIGYPNVGKSSLLNSLIGRKVVSVSKTPGHTKHLQTIFLTPTVRLCDCPGLVFPSYVDRSLQVMAGIFPIAQLRDPYSVVDYLARRLDLPKLLRLNHPDQDQTANCSVEQIWSAFDICESWAVKCGYYTAKASRPDVYRAANRILRLAVEGRLRLCFVPPGYFSEADAWKSESFTECLREGLDQQVSRPVPSEQFGEGCDVTSDTEIDDHKDDLDSFCYRACAVNVPCSSNPFKLLAGD